MLGPFLSSIELNTVPDIAKIDQNSVIIRMYVLKSTDE